MTEEEFESLLDEVAGEQSSEKPKFDPRFCEKKEGATPNGGDYSVAYYYDKDGNPCLKEQANAVNIIEYSNSGERINETYGLLG